MIGACGGMVYVEQKKMIHRDIAARNLLVDEHNKVKISDFGLARFYDQYYNSSSAVIPVRWSAPEILRQGKVTSKCDVFSFGVVMWEIMEFGRIPWTEFSNSQVIDKILNYERLPCPKNCPQELYDMMKKCWHDKTDDRPTFALLHRMLREYVLRITKPRGELTVKEPTDQPLEDIKPPIARKRTNNYDEPPKI